MIQEGVTDDLSDLICHDYSEEEIELDRTQIDCEQVLAEIENTQATRRDQELELIAQKEREYA